MKLQIPENLKEYESETSENHREQIYEMHLNDFKDHTVTEESPGTYLCKRPDTSMHSFRVVFMPGAILVYGDIGNMLVAQDTIEASLGCLMPR